MPRLHVLHRLLDLREGRLGLLERGFEPCDFRSERSFLLLVCVGERLYRGFVLLREHRERALLLLGALLLNAINRYFLLEHITLDCTKGGLKFLIQALHLFRLALLHHTELTLLFEEFHEHDFAQFLQALQRAHAVI